MICRGHLIHGGHLIRTLWVLFFYSLLSDLINNSSLNARAASEAEIERNFKLEDFTYNNTSILKVLSRHLANTDFHGISVSGTELLNIVVCLPHNNFPIVDCLRKCRLLYADSIHAGISCFDTLKLKLVTPVR